MDGIASGGSMTPDLLDSFKGAVPTGHIAPIVPVQGGGGQEGSVIGWQSIPVSIEHIPDTLDISVNPGLIRKFKTKWQQILGPNIPSRRKPRRDPHIIIGTINVSLTPTFVVAPLRGNVEKANDVFTWADNLLASDPETRVIFMSPVSNTLAKHLRALLTKYVGQALYVCKGESDIPSLDGILLHAVPHTSKQIALGFIPQHENVYHRSSREMHGIKFDTLLIPSARYNDAESGESMYTLDFEIPKTIQPRETDHDRVSIRGDKSFKMTPGWVTMLTFGQPAIEGGASSIVTLPDKSYKIENATPDVIAKWNKGEFTPEEKLLLENSGLKYPDENKVYSAYLKGMLDPLCKKETGVALSDHCKIFNYLTKHDYYMKMRKFKNNANTGGITVSKDSKSKEVKKDKMHTENNDDDEDLNDENNAGNTPPKDPKDPKDPKGLMTGGDLTQAVAKYKLDEAKKTHSSETLDSKELNFTAALDSMQGNRGEQEDAHILKVHDDKKFAVFAVFDGHGGSQVSKWLETNFNDKLVGAKFKIDGDLNAQKKFFKQLYIDIDEELSKKQFNSGSTAIVVIVTTTKIIVVNLGDSRAIGIKTGNPKPVFETQDHDPKYEGEEARVKASGYTIETFKGETYVSGKGCGLNLTRAFGDFNCKKFEENGKPASPEKQAVSVVPDIALYDRKDVDCIILGCDGVWNFIQNATMAKWIQEPDNIKRSPKELASDIIDNALVLNTGDNISAIVIKLNKSEGQGQQAPPQPPLPRPPPPPLQPPQPPPLQPPQPPQPQQQQQAQAQDLAIELFKNTGGTMDPMSNFAVTQVGGAKKGSLLHGNAESAKTALKDVKLGDKEVSLVVNCSNDTTLAGDLEKLKNTWNTANPATQKVLIQLPLTEPDSLNGKLHTIKDALTAIKTALDSGKNVLVSCSAGVNRSTTILIMYLMEHEKMSLWDAWKLVHSKRNVACPMPTFAFELWDDALWGGNTIRKKEQHLGKGDDKQLREFFKDVMTAKAGDRKFLNPYFNSATELGAAGLYQYGELQAGGEFKFDAILNSSLEGYSEESYYAGLCNIFRIVWSDQIKKCSKKPSRPVAVAKGGTRRRKVTAGKTKRLIKFYY